VDEFKFNTFNDWFDQLEGFHLLSERFYAENEQHDAQYMTRWLKAAFAAGREKNEQQN